MKERIEYRRYTPDAIDEVLKSASRLALVGTIYYGKVNKQEVRRCEDGSIEVLTHHTQVEVK